MRGRKSSALFQALAFIVALLLCAADVVGESTPIPHGSLELIADKQSIAAGNDLALGLHFQLEKGWHIYWINPGDSGEPLRVEWQLPTGVTAGPIQWPTPRRLQSSSVVDYGYEDSVLLIVPLHAAAALTPAKAPPAEDIRADIKLLVCSHDMCVPGKAELSLSIPVKASASLPDTHNAELFAAARQSLPHPARAKWKFSVNDATDSFVLAANAGHPIRQAIFFPLIESQIENAAPQKFSSEATGFRLTLRKSDQLLKPIARLKGVLVVSGDVLHADHPDYQLDQAFVIDVPVGKTGAAKNRSTDGTHALQ